MTVDGSATAGFRACQWRATGTSNTGIYPQILWPIQFLDWQVSLTTCDWCHPTMLWAAAAGGHWIVFQWQSALHHVIVLEDPNPLNVWTLQSLIRLPRLLCSGWERSQKMSYWTLMQSKIGSNFCPNKLQKCLAVPYPGGPKVQSNGGVHIRFRFVKAIGSYFISSN